MAEQAHTPVQLDEVIEAFKPKRGKVLVDCTVGLGGHSAAFLKKGARVIGLDLDPANLTVAQARLEEVGGNFALRHANFAGLPTVLAELGLECVDGILADLGVSSPHIDDPSRGFSYRRSGPLDMRMDPTSGRPAWMLLERMGEAELAAAIRELGDEEDAAEIARLIVQRRPVRTTQQLTAIVCEARDFTLQRAAGAKLHPAARTFQALRMLVNRELPNLERLLAVIPSCLAPSGIAGIISFHSGEDRRVKHAFRDGLHAGIYDRASEDPIMATPDETAANRRARSAKFRWARKSKK